MADPEAIQEWAKALRRETVQSLDQLADGPFEDMPDVRSVFLIAAPDGTYTLGIFAKGYTPERLKDEGMIGIYAATEQAAGACTTYTGKPFKAKSG